MEITRQQNEDLDRLAGELARAKKLEEIRGQEIEASARLKSEFLANFSHEIRTPLNGILGYCDLVLREEGQRLTPHGRRDLSVIKANARTLLALINDILDLSKIEAGRVEIVNEHVDMEALVEECGSTVRETLRGKQVELRTFVDAGAKDVFTDPLKLKQVLLNLLSNAAKFTDTGEVVLTATAKGPALVIVVEDTGSGIPSDQLPHIFEKFRQVDGSPSRRVGGTGLGLAIVREVAKLLGGTVEVTSSLGRGSAFTVVLSRVIDRGRDGRAVQPGAKTELSAVDSAPGDDGAHHRRRSDDPSAPARSPRGGRLPRLRSERRHRRPHGGARAPAVRHPPGHPSPEARRMGRPRAAQGRARAGGDSRGHALGRGAARSRASRSVHASTS